MRRIGGLVVSLLLLALSTGSAAAQDVDAISAASTKNYHENTSLSGKKLMKALEKYQAAVSVATVNPDGTPNAAVVIPSVVDENTLMFGLSDNQTKRNLLERKLAVVTVYIYTPGKKGKFGKSRGARLIVRLIEDNALIEQFGKRVKTDEGSLFVTIVKVLPLG